MAMKGKASASPMPWGRAGSSWKGARGGGSRAPGGARGAVSLV